MKQETERKALGQVIRALRELAGLSRQELAEGADLGVDMIAKVEQGAKAPSAAALKRIASALGCDPIELSNRGLLWAEMEGSPEASVALLRHIATGASVAGPVVRRALGLRSTSAPGLQVLAAVAAGTSAAGYAFAREKRTRNEIEKDLRRRLQELLTEASTEDLVKLEAALELAENENPPSD